MHAVLPPCSTVYVYIFIDHSMIANLETSIPIIVEPFAILADYDDRLGPFKSTQKVLNQSIDHVRKYCRPCILTH